MKRFCLAGMLLAAVTVDAKTPILSDASLMQEAGIQPQYTDVATGVAYAEVETQDEARLSQIAHGHQRCGGYEVLPDTSDEPLELFGPLRAAQIRNELFQTSFDQAPLQERESIHHAMIQVDAQRIQKDVEWMSSFSTRFNRSAQANEAVNALKLRLDTTARAAPYPVQVELISHTSTPQKSIRVRIAGKTRPDEIIVLGAHFDSINQEGWFGSEEAPGADDNASGSADLVEALRVVLQQPQPERSIEFFWYAGEESGLLGSAEIARSYREQNRQVIAVLQLDMTLFPGAGEFVLGSMTDFTSSWMRSYLTELNRLYIKAQIVEDKCGYGCSDHASWYRQGYPTLMPFEATFNQMNENLHTTRDRIDSRSDFAHAAMFAKIAIAIALDLGNSTTRQP